MLAYIAFFFSITGATIAVGALIQNISQYLYFKRNKINGNQQYTNLTLSYVSFAIATMLIGFSGVTLDTLFTGFRINYTDKTILYQASIFTILLSLCGLGFSALILYSRHHFLIWMAKITDTDGHSFKKLAIVTMLGIWPDGGALNLDQDFKNVLQKVSHWHFHVLMSDEVTLEQIIMDTSEEEQFDIIYLATHSTGQEIALSDSEYVDISAFCDFVKSKKAKLVVLGVCVGSDLAKMLLDSGIQTVVYWLNAVEDKYAIIFARIFFSSLSDGNTVQGSIENARILLPAHIGRGSLRVRGYRLLSFPTSKR